MLLAALITFVFDKRQSATGLFTAARKT